MQMPKINLADAKARLSELIARAAGGESIQILRRGKPVAEIVPTGRARKPIALAWLEAVTADMPEQCESARDAVRRMRDEARY